MALHGLKIAARGWDVRGILSKLLKMYSTFQLYTHTPCLPIYDNIVHTPRGDIHAKCIVHATNRWTSHLLAPMRETIVLCSFVLYPGTSEDRWDYLTQQPPNPATLGEKSHAEFMFGGGIEMRRIWCW
ncbi:hypothetical protein ARMSODRAFT_1025298 [Armillaria solidipes]|uniref:FAD dependent oxidoreductase domain-containing protein n=1 Tax=Armillaria solidipes TaxID=1076256 RepID=A0A2H3ATC1_9AGAR|nr:hypothetical protein ARMSODRAFT_1025298 [Armillaria solidipes]